MSEIRRAPELDWRYVESEFQEGLWHYPVSIKTVFTENTEPTSGKLTMTNLLTALEKTWKRSSVASPDIQFLIVDTSEEGMDWFTTDRDVPIMVDGKVIYRYRIGQTGNPNAVALELSEWATPFSPSRED